MNMKTIQRPLTFTNFLQCLLLVGTASAVCPNGYKMNPNDNARCYKAVRSNLDTTRDQAEAACQANDNSHLAAAFNENDNNVYINDPVFADGDRIWLGLRRAPVTTHLKWQYLDGTFIQNQGCYVYNQADTDFSFMTSSPAGGVTHQTCLDHCKTDSNYAYAAVKGTPGNFLCGCARADFSRDKPWEDRSLSGDRACIQLCDGANPHSLKCGNTDRMVVLKIYNTSGLDMWAYSQPNFYDGLQFVALINSFHNPPKYDDSRPNEQHGYICQDNSYSFYVFDDSRSWFDANNDCRSRYTGGRLAKLRDSTDRDSLNLQPDTKYWIGLTQDTWTWPNGDRLGWSGFESTEPDWKDECVTLLRDFNDQAKWREEGCDTKLRNYVCEIRAVTATTTSTTVNVTMVTEANVTSGESAATSTAGSATTTKDNNNNNNNNNSTTVVAPTAGRSTNNSSGLSVLEIILIVLSCVLVILVILLIVFVCYYKRKNNKKNKVGDEGQAKLDARGESHKPQNGEVYIPAGESDVGSTGSREDLIRPTRRPTNSQRPSHRIRIDDRY